MKVKDCMCTDVHCCSTNATVTDCAKIMKDYHVGCVPVCDEKNNIVGIITDRDIALRCVSCEKEADQTPVTQTMSSQTCCCTPETNVEDATNLMCQYQIRRIPVIENNKVVGILTLGDLARNAKVSQGEVIKCVDGICAPKGTQQNNF